MQTVLFLVLFAFNYNLHETILTLLTHKTILTILFKYHTFL